MKKWLWLVLAALVIVILRPLNTDAAGDVTINATNFPNAAFRSYISSTFDTDGNGVLSASEIAAAKKISVTGKGITSMTGLEHFTSLKELYCGDNQLVSLDVGSNTELELLYCDNNTKLTNLKNVRDHSKLKDLDLEGCTALTLLDCTDCALEDLNVSDCTALKYLYCGNNQLKSLDLYEIMDLEILSCFGNKLTSLYLEELGSLKTIDVAYNASLTSLICEGCPLTSLNVNGCKALSTLNCCDANLTSLNVSTCTALTSLDCTDNQLTSLDLSNNYALEKLYCEGNKLSQLDVSWNSALERLYCGANSGFSKLVLGRHYVLNTIDCTDNTLKSLDLSGCAALQYLYCSTNLISSLDVSPCTGLYVLECDHNELTSLDVGGCHGLVTLKCHKNKLTSLDVSNCTDLRTLNCINNQLTALQINENAKLESLSCYGNQIAALYLTSCPNMLSAYTNGTKTEGTTTSGTTYWSYTKRVNSTNCTLKVDQSTEIRTSGFQWTRLAGSDRYATMAMASKKAFEEHSCKTIIVATGQAFPDALAGSALAGVYGCPIILTKTSALSPQAAEELRRLAASSCKVLILGGNGAVSEAVENAILDLPGLITYTVERVKGSNREATALAVYENGKAAGGFKSGGTVIIATGYSFADALSVSPYAYASKTPILLAKKDGSLGADTKALIKSEGFKKAIIIGGNGAVSEATENYLKKTCKMQVLRLSGSNRYETSANILKWELGKNSGAAFQPAVSMTLEGLGTATGSKFADALGAVSLLGKTASPLLLVSDSNKTNKSATQANIKAIVKPGASSMTKGYIFGGKGAVSLQIEGWLNNAVK